VKIMLLFGQSANETFSSGREGAEEHFLAQPAAPRSGSRLGFSRHAEEDAMAAAAIRRGDEVVFERLDLAEALGIWRHARGRIVGIHGQGGRAVTVDVAFDGHEVLERYLPDLFRRMH
jgi:hypothetical protein